MKGVDFEVSATTTMSRVGPLVQTIEDLAEKQVIQPTSYNIYCSKKVARLVSRRLSSRFSKLIKVKVRDDAGPATKAIYHLESQEVPLVTVDDDVFYDKYLFLRLLQNHERSPKAVISDRVHRVSHSKAGLLKPYLEWSREVENTHEASHNLFLTGVGGVLYPKKSMHPDACDIKLQNKLAFYVDDVWWWVQALRNGTQIMSPHGSRRLRYIGGTQDAGLWQTGNKERNDQALAALATWYGVQKSVPGFMGKYPETSECSSPDPQP